MATFQTKSLSACALMLAVAGTSAVPASAASLRGPGAEPKPARSMIIPVCEPNCVGGAHSTDSNSRPEYDDIPYTGPQTDGAPNSTFDNTSPPDASDFAGSPGSTFDNPVPYREDEPPPGDGLSAEPAAPEASAPFDPYEALRSATPR